MRVITCASFYGTGSSAVTDYFSEYDDICSLGNYEYRFLHEPDGIADLHYNVIENNNRHNTSDSIKRYIKYTDKLVKMGYGGYDIFDGNFEKYTKEFIEDITELKVHTWWNKDRTDRGRLFVLIDRIYSKLKCIFTGNLGTEIRFSLLTKLEYGYYTAISEEEFLGAVKRYVQKLLSYVNKNNKPFVMVDQMVPPTGLNRYVKYFDDVKIFVVDRDPRDVYILEKEFWKWGVIPVDDVRDYVKWFLITRKYATNVQEDKDKVLRIKFEDMIYDYENTTEKLREFAGISKEKHVRVRQIFNPDISIKNTNLKEQVKKYEEDIRYIEEHLKEYLYDFDAIRG